MKKQKSIIKSSQAILWSLGEKPKTVTELKHELNLAFGTLSYHLKFLIDHNIIKKSKNQKERGQPTTYSLRSYKEIMKNEFEENLELVKQIISNIKKAHDQGLIEKTKYNSFKEEVIKSLGD